MWKLESFLEIFVFFVRTNLETINYDGDCQFIFTFLTFVNIYHNI